MNTSFSKATKVYVGRDSGCRCGCHGTYHDAGSRGFKQALTRAQKIVAENPNAVTDVCDDYANITTGEDRAITVYFN